MLQLLDAAQNQMSPVPGEKPQVYDCQFNLHHLTIRFVKCTTFRIFYFYAVLPTITFFFFQFYHLEFSDSLKTTSLVPELGLFRVWFGPHQTAIQTVFRGLGCLAVLKLRFRLWFQANRSLRFGLSFNFCKPNCTTNRNFIWFFYKKN